MGWARCWAAAFGLSAVSSACRSPKTYTTSTTSGAYMPSLTALPASSNIMSGSDVYVPSLTKKGPLYARDIEQARMPCYLGLDYPDDGTQQQQPRISPQPNSNSNLMKKKKKKKLDGHIPETCALCFDDLTPASIFRRLPCNHLLHKHCIDHWLCTKDASCPFCRQTFYHLRKPIVLRSSSLTMVGDDDGEDKDELEMGRAAFVLWLKGILGLA